MLGVCALFQLIVVLILILQARGQIRTNFSLSMDVGGLLEISLRKDFTWGTELEPHIHIHRNFTVSHCFSCVCLSMYHLSIIPYLWTSYD